MGACGSKPKESDIVESLVPTDNVVVDSKNETDTTLVQLEESVQVLETIVYDMFDSQEKTEESSDEAKTEGESSEATEAEPTPEAVKSDEKVPSETEPPKQETAPAKTDEAPLVIL
uniref:Uncharacterized protein n=1 Tax=Brassica oleracea TaxID=3712 RepID=A0A3P6FWU1_BRAOL|nr:unnamed protein product [Brassica oleracea]